MKAKKIKKKKIDKLEIVVDVLIMAVVISGVLSFGFIATKLEETPGFLELSDIKINSYDDIAKTMSITLYKSGRASNYVCHVDGSNNTYESEGIDKTCTFTVDLNDNYNMYLSTEDGTKSNVIESDNSINKVIDFSYKEDTIYLIPGETKKLEYTSSTIGKIDFEFNSTNSDIAKLEDGKIKAISVGETTITSKQTDKELKVVVTNLITKPTATKSRKQILPCGAYSEEEATTLDNILEYKVNDAGYKTRAGALAAARFLTLEFKYRVPYYYETGRIPYENNTCTYKGVGGYTNINTSKADGEGRYYHKGLYLSESKFSSISYTVKGKKTWGCKMINIEDKPEYGYVSGAMVPNGLDCSGFVTWSLKQAGYDPGDVGAGEDPNRDCQCTDLGPLKKLNETTIDEMKPGDLLNWWGHIAMYIGYDGDNYYVAESLPAIGGVRAMIYSRSKLIETFEYTINMDDFYGEEGTYTTMWTTE